MRRSLSILLALALAVAALVYDNRDRLVDLALAPLAPFDQATAPPPARYGEASGWLALPERPDIADAVPPGVSPGDQQRVTGVDAFVVLPAPQVPNEGWNLPANATDTDRRNPRSVLPSAFNACCRVYVPRYRAAVDAAFIDHDPESARKALSLAYQDIRHAFDYYLEHWNGGRPIVIAGLGQGSLLLERLLGDIAAGDPALRERIIIAYLPGQPVPLDLFQGLLAGFRPCATPTEIRCVASWTTSTGRGDPGGFPHGETWDRAGNLVPVAARPVLCTNPIGFRANLQPTPLTDHHGATLWIPPGDQLETVTPALVSAVCRGGRLLISPPGPLVYRLEAKDGDYQAYDAALFWADIRANSLERLRSWAALNNAGPAEGRR